MPHKGYFCVPHERNRDCWSFIIEFWIRKPKYVVLFRIPGLEFVHTRLNSLQSTLKACFPKIIFRVASSEFDVLLFVATNIVFGGRMCSACAPDYAEWAATHDIPIPY